MTVRAHLLAVLLSLAGGCATWGTAPERFSRESGWRTVPDVHAYAQTGPLDCGSAALASVLRHWEPALDLEAVRRLTGPPDANGITAGRLRAVARDRGLRAYLVPGSLADFDRELAAGRPILVGLVPASDLHILEECKRAIAEREKVRKRRRR